MKSNSLSSFAVMNVEKGEEIAGMWVTPHLDGIGIYKLIAKKKADGTCEWAHFVQRDNGVKEKVTRGTLEDPGRLSDVLEAFNRALHTAFGTGVTFQHADTDVYTLDGKKASPTRH
ncbi:MAG: hypothetical protein AB1531_09845 [Chloroflexota bacterium]